ncbi:MAG: hypothetical protein KF726_02900 [Anaerolineae bacterium]|nr:hypothetical protein [Anaerolineae bacterium]
MDAEIRSRPISLRLRRWYLYLTLLLLSGLILATVLHSDSSISAAQVTSTPTLIPVASIPIHQIAGFEHVIVGQTRWSEITPKLLSLGYSVNYAFTRATGELVYAVGISDPSAGNLETPHIRANVDVYDDIITLLIIDFRHPTTHQFPHTLWQLIDPAKLISTFGVPDRIHFNVGGGASYGYFLTFFWHTSTLAAIYEGRVLPQDERGTIFRICTHMSRMSSVILFTAPDFTELQQRLDNLNFVDATSELSQDMLIGSTDLAVVADQLMTGDCLFTPVERWVQLEVTWTPWAGVTDTATPMSTKTTIPLAHN